jgi:hypothetical protein
MRVYCLCSLSRLLMSFVLLVMSAAPPAAVAQQPSGESAPAGVSGTAARSGSGETDKALVDDLKSTAASLRASAYVAVAVSLVAGVGVFIYRRKRLMPLSRTAGALTTVVLALVLFALFSMIVVSPESAACASATLQKGDAGTDYDDACRIARESGANAFGFASAFRAIFIEDAMVPIGAGMLKVLAYISVLLVSLLAFLIARPVAQKLWIRV